MHEKYAVGVDVGGSHVSAAVINLNTGQIEGRVMENAVDSSLGAASTVRQLSDCIERTVEGVKVSHIEGVGLAFPGPFDYVNGISLISGVGKYDSIYGLDVRSSLIPALYKCGISQIGFINDASAFALGESTWGASSGFSRSVAITLGTGVGSCFISAGKVVDSGDSVPAEGWVYCLPYLNGIADDYFSTRWICRRYEELSGVHVSGAKDVAEKYEDDKAAQLVFSEYGRGLGGFLSAVLVRFNAEVLVLGGNISRSYPLLRREMEQAIPGNIRIRVSRFLDCAALMGAASIFKNK